MEKNTIGDFIITVAILLVIVLVLYGGCEALRWWEQGSREQAKQEIRKELEPLRKELLELKERVSDLEEQSRNEK